MAHRVKKWAVGHAPLRRIGAKNFFILSVILGMALPYLDGRQGGRSTGPDEGRS